jgi:hypothetical protein
VDAPPLNRRRVTPHNIEQFTVENQQPVDRADDLPLKNETTTPVGPRRRTLGPSPPQG